MKRFLVVCLLLAVPLVLAAPQQAPPNAPAREPGLYATLDTSMGKIVIRLFEEESPKTVASFVALATGQKGWQESTGAVVRGKPFYDGIIFHRVIPNFMIQTGAHLPDGGYRSSAKIPDEFESGLKFDRPGRLGMANAGPNTGSSQFFITHAATPHLNGKHTVFGQVVEGQDVVVAIGNVSRDAEDKPRSAVLLKKVILERVGPAPTPAAKPAAASKPQ